MIGDAIGSTAIDFAKSKIGLRCSIGTGILMSEIYFTRPETEDPWLNLACKIASLGEVTTIDQISPISFKARLEPCPSSCISAGS
jgi:hypothetical protein